MKYFSYLHQSVGIIQQSKMRSGKVYYGNKLNDILFYYIKVKKVKELEWLIQHGANIYQKSRFGHKETTAFAFAMRSSDNDVKDLFLKTHEENIRRKKYSEKEIKIRKNLQDVKRILHNIRRDYQINLFYHKLPFLITKMQILVKEAYSESYYICENVITNNAFLMLLSLIESKFVNVKFFEQEVDKYKVYDYLIMCSDIIDSIVTLLLK